MGDSIALGETLNLRCIFLSGPEWVHQRLREADALIELAGESQNAELALFGHRWRLVSMLELGETEAAERELEAYERVSDQARAGSARWYALTLHATRAFVEGRLEEAERLTLEAFAQRRREPTELTVYTFGVQLLWLRREQGRLSELAPYVRAHPLDSRIPMMAAFRATAALLDLETGSPEDAREQLARLAENDLADLPRDFTYLYGLAVLSELCAALGDPACAATLYDALRPFADRQVVLFMGTVYLGSAERYLGQLAATMGNGERAEAHFEEALRSNERVRARLWVAHTQLDWARMLLARGGADATARAEELLGSCRATASELGLAGLLGKAEALASQLRGETPSTR